MTNLTPEERATKNQIIENISETYVPVSVIEDIKREFSPLYGYGATEIWKIIDEHIDEYIKEYTNE